MKKIKLSIFITIFSITAVLPFTPLVFAANDYNSTVKEIVNGSKLDYSGFVNCDGVLKDKAAEPNRQKACDFAALVGLVNKMINWMFIISIPVATVLFAYAGLLYLRGTQDTRRKANSIFVAVVVGFIIMLVAWFSIRTLVDFFVESNFGATTLVK